MTIFNKYKVWIRGKNDFAIEIDEPDMRGLFSKQVTIEQGTKALILQGGVYCGFLPSGTYRFGDLSTRLGLNLERHTTIIIVDSGEVEIPFGISEYENLRTKDAISVSVTGSITITICNPLAFLENYLKHSSSISISEISSNLHRDIAVCIRSVVSEVSIENLLGNSEVLNRMRTLLKEEVNKTTSQKGIEVCSVGAIELDAKSWGHVLSAKGGAKIELEEAKTATETDIQIRAFNAANKVDEIKTRAAVERAQREEEEKAELDKLGHSQEMESKKFSLGIGKVKTLMQVQADKEKMDFEAEHRYTIADLEKEKITLENRSNASTPALISILNSENPNSREIAKVELAKRGACLSPEQLLAVQAGYSDAVANTMKECYANRKGKSLDDETLKVIREFAEKEEQMFYKSLDAMGRVATAKSSAPVYPSEQERRGNTVRYIKCPNCGEFNVETEEYCIRCKRRLH